MGVAASPGRSILYKTGRSILCDDRICPMTTPILSKRTKAILSFRLRRVRFVSAQKAWSSAGRRGPHFGVGAGVCLGCAASCGVACVWAPWASWASGYVLLEGSGVGVGGRLGARASVVSSSSPWAIPRNFTSLACQAPLCIF